MCGLPTGRPPPSSPPRRSGPPSRRCSRCRRGRRSPARWSSSARGPYRAPGRRSLSRLPPCRLPDEVQVLHGAEDARLVDRLLALLHGEFGDPLEPLFEDAAQLGPGEVRTDATVRADAEGRMQDGLPVDVDLAGVLHDAGIPRGAGVAEHDELVL